MNIRTAILKAADSIEQNPKLYEFDSRTVPPCGSPGCLFGWIGFHMGLKVDTLNWTVAEAMGLTGTPSLYAFMNNVVGLDYVFNAATAAKGLRLYANKYRPTEAKPTGIPDWCRQIFVVEEAA